MLVLLVTLLIAIGVFYFTLLFVMFILNSTSNNNNNNTAFISGHISSHCGHSEAHYSLKHVHIINNIVMMFMVE